MERAFRSLPSVDRVLQDPALDGALWPRVLATDAVRAALAAARERVATGGPASDVSDIVRDALARLRASVTPSLRTVVNATGVILHTNLGRAPISEAAAAAMASVASSYSNLEFDLASGERGSRATHVRSLLQEVTGAADGFAVNNNAGALLLALTALAADQDVVISRGQAVEIGGGFRIPDVMRQSGARLVEVGTTNRTYIGDYADAVTDQTALLLRVHPSNFRLEGFVHSVSVAELASLGRQRSVAVLDDVGSGALLDPRAYGLGEEPLVQDSVRAGATVVCFSGDKLLGGPQAGIIVGERSALDRIRRHPLARALRIDKASLAGLEATLRHYQRGEATTHVPIWRMIATPADEVERRARAVANALGLPGRRRRRDSRRGRWRIAPSGDVGVLGAPAHRRGRGAGRDRATTAGGGAPGCRPRSSAMPSCSISGRLIPPTTRRCSASCGRSCSRSSSTVYCRFH